ncbi:methyltransferase [Actinokineospora inagensis]|uniref:methyltransferase n=1 Tax=Actinokineospora inagensis TaxID=103730 RepID=UPI0004238FB5|nr:methyltransferase [Actinokineospora inagensis]
MSAEHSPAYRLNDLMTGYWKTQAISVTARLGIVDAVAHERLSSADLAEKLAVDRDSLHRLLLFLVTLGVLSGDERTGYAATEVGELLRVDNPGTMAHYAKIYGDEFYTAWGHLEGSVRTGKSAFSLAYGQELFPYLQSHPETSLSYERAMIAGANFFGEVDTVYPFPETGLVVDIAGGHGLLLRQILAKRPELRGMLFDRPQVIAEAKEHGFLGDFADRCTLVAGDIFETAPTGGDIYLMSRLLHCFDDAGCLALLGNCRDAFATGTRLLIVERLLPEDGQVSLTPGYNMHMLAVMGQGRERTRSQFADLLAQTGFRLDGAHALPLDAYVLAATRV